MRSKATTPNEALSTFHACIWLLASLVFFDATSGHCPGCGFLPALPWPGSGGGSQRGGRSLLPCPCFALSRKHKRQGQEGSGPERQEQEESRHGRHGQNGSGPEVQREEREGQEGWGAWGCKRTRRLLQMALQPVRENKTLCDQEGK